MLYKFRVMEHGKEEFDKNYFGIFFKKYNKSELLFYYRWFKGWIKFLDKFLSLKKGQGRSVLEVGCAIGAFSKLLKERGFEVTATDISEFIIKKARQLQKDVKFKVLDIENSPEIDEKYDYIFAFEVLEHLNNPQKALLNMKELLKEGGVLVFSTPLPTKQTLADPMHINIHSHNFWLSLGKELKFKKVYLKDATFLPYFYRFSSIFSRGIAKRMNLPFVNNTCFYFFEN